MREFCGKCLAPIVSFLFHVIHVQNRFVENAKTKRWAGAQCFASACITGGLGDGYFKITACNQIKSFKKIEILNDINKNINLIYPLYGIVDLQISSLAKSHPSVHLRTARATATGFGSLWFDRGIAPAGAAVPRIWGLGCEGKMKSKSRDKMVHTVCTIVIFFCFFLSQLGFKESLNSWNLNGCPCFFLVGIHPKIAILLVLDCWCSNFHQSSKLPRTQRLRPWRSIDTSSKFAAKPLSTTRCFGGFLGDKFETSILDDVFS